MVDSNKSIAFGKPTIMENVENATINELYREIERNQKHVCYVCHKLISSTAQKAESTFDILTGQKVSSKSPFDNVPKNRLQLRLRHLYHRPLSSHQAYAMSESEAENLHRWSIRMARFL